MFTNRETIKQSIQNISCFMELNLCQNCVHYIPISDSRVPNHFRCSRMFELVDFPININQILKLEEDGNYTCSGYIPKQRMS